jgi:hypothetical protein
MAKLSEAELAALQRAWQPGTSPWEAMLPYLDRLARHPENGPFFGGLRNFVEAAASEPSLAARHVHPSTINLAVFETADPVGYGEAARHRRVVVSPAGPDSVRVRYYSAEPETPGSRRIAPAVEEPENARARARPPAPILRWDGDPREAIAFIRQCFVS